MIEREGGAQKRRRRIRYDEYTTIQICEMRLCGREVCAMGLSLDWTARLVPFPHPIPPHEIIPHPSSAYLSIPHPPMQTTGEDRPHQSTPVAKPMDPGSILAIQPSPCPAMPCHALSGGTLPLPPTFPFQKQDSTQYHTARAIERMKRIPVSGTSPLVMHWRPMSVFRVSFSLMDGGE